MGESTLAVISIDPASGRPEHNVWAVMETIYDDYREHPERKINEKFEEVLNKVLSSDTQGIYLHTAIEELIYQLNCEKNGSSPFVVDSKKMIAGLRENIMKNKDKFEIANMMQELEDYNTILSEHFNQTIL